jgi:hypothetical protein
MLKRKNTNLQNQKLLKEINPSLEVFDNDQKEICDDLPNLLLIEYNKLLNIVEKEVGFLKEELSRNYEKVKLVENKEKTNLIFFERKYLDFKRILNSFQEEMQFELKKLKDQEDNLKNEINYFKKQKHLSDGKRVDYFYKNLLLNSKNKILKEKNRQISSKLFNIKKEKAKKSSLESNFKDFVEFKFPYFRNEHFSFFLTIINLILLLLFIRKNKSYNENEKNNEYNL